MIAICVVRVENECYQRGNTCVYGKSIRVLKKHTSHDLLADEINAVGILDALENIVNLSSCDPGVYSMDVCNISRDIESGQIDGYSFELVKFEVPF